MFLGLYDDRFVAGQSQLVQAIQHHGARACAQLMHAGKYLPSFLMNEKPVSASAIRSTVTGEVPHALERSEIQSIIHAYATAAARAKRCRYDAVEILAATGYLISQFLSPTTNMRDDEYGGSLEKRARFGCEVITAVRAGVGSLRPLSWSIVGACETLTSTPRFSV